MTVPSERTLNEEHGVMLQELRVTLPGMQMLFAFLLTIPFAQGWEKTTALMRGVYAVDLLCTGLSSIFLIGPAVYHRLHWRRHVEDKDKMLRIINVLAIIGQVFLSLAIVSSVFLVIDYLYGDLVSALVTGVIGVTLLVVWYALPLTRRTREARS